MICDPCCLFFRFRNLWRTKLKSLLRTIKKSPSSLFIFFSVSSITSTIKKVLFQKSIELKMRVKRLLLKDKTIVQSRDQANNSLDLDQSCCSSQIFYWFVIELLQQHRVILHPVRILWSNEI